MAAKKTLLVLYLNLWVAYSCQMDGNTHVYDTKLSAEAIIELVSSARHLEFQNGRHSYSFFTISTRAGNIIWLNERQCPILLC